MLEIRIPGDERWDARNNVFVYDKPAVLRLEHSLLSLSKWESKWHKPFLDESKPKTPAETLDYIRCMTLTQGVDPSVYDRLTRENMAAIQRYMADPMSAATFKERKNGKKRARYQSAETFYAAMASYGIPFSCEKWHLNRLLALIRACGEENMPPEKMGRREQAAHIRALNAQRRAKMHSRG